VEVRPDNFVRGITGYLTELPFGRFSRTNCASGALATDVAPRSVLRSLEPRLIHSIANESIIGMTVPSGCEQAHRPVLGHFRTMSAFGTSWSIADATSSNRGL
jgi:hypothetical protein